MREDKNKNKKRQYKISCEFFIEAEDKEEAIEILAWDTDFIENHIIVDEVEKEDKARKEADARDIYLEQKERQEGSW